jgi:hypothetical protein
MLTTLLREQVFLCMMSRTILASRILSKLLRLFVLDQEIDYGAPPNLPELVGRLGPNSNLLLLTLALPILSFRPLEEDAGGQYLILTRRRMMNHLPTQVEVYSLVPVSFLGSRALAYSYVISLFSFWLRPFIGLQI